MRLLLGLFCVFVLTLSATPFAHQPSQPNACGFTIQSNSAQPEITGPPDMVPLVYVIEQPDSPIEIQSVNLDGSWLSVVGDRYTERTIVKYQVRNGSDRTVRRVQLLLGYNGRSGAGASNSAPISPGESATLIAEVAGSGNVGVHPLKILIYVGPIESDDCALRPSVRVPLSLGVKPPLLW
jgi:hypothetical protein